MTTEKTAATAALRIFHLQPGSGCRELQTLPQAPPAQGFYWIACTREALAEHLAPVQACLQAVTGASLLDLHVSDLLNVQRPSGYDYTAQYDLLVFRRLLQSPSDAAAAGLTGQPAPPRPGRRVPPVLRQIDTSPMGFALWDALLLSVHPHDCSVRDAYAARLLAAQPTDPREGRFGAPAGARLPSSTADLMLRALNVVVDGFLALRRELSRQLDHWHAALLRPHARFADWGALLRARLALHELDEVCEDQRNALQKWSETLDEGEPTSAQAARERELLQVRTRDVIEHIERMAHHVRRLEQGTETVVQMHFSMQSNRANDIMRTLTALTAVFLPLNLLAGIFGMNFDFIPLIHQHNGFWWAVGAMALMAAALVLVFWRKRYLARSQG